MRFRMASTVCRLLPQTKCRLLRLPQAAACDDRGQGTVEFAIVTAALLAALVAGATAFHVFENGLLVNHAVYSASHHVQGDAVGAFADVFSY